MDDAFKVYSFSVGDLKPAILILKKTSASTLSDKPFTANSTVRDSGFTARSFDAEINILTRTAGSELPSDAISLRILSAETKNKIRKTQSLTNVGYTEMVTIGKLKAVEVLLIMLDAILTFKIVDEILPLRKRHTADHNNSLRP